MQFLIYLLILGQTLAYNPTLEQVAINRQTMAVRFKISKQIDIDQYQCLIGVPYGFGWLIGHEVYFVEDDKVTGPWLVVDVEAEHHAGIMDRNNLLADTDCKEFVHKRGRLIMKNE